MNQTVHQQKVAATLVWFFYSVTTVLLAVLLSWAIYSQFNYGYPFWYQQLAIDEHIDHYGPQNRFKKGFEQLPAEQHYQAFEQIRRAVHAQGEGLHDIRYETRGRSQRLLRRAEVRHLEDVARLIDMGRVLAAVLLCALLPLAWLCIRLSLPPMRWRWGLTVASAGAVVAWLVIAGPTAVFYQFHLWLFPAENQWFFYWQESLMSTLMKAPYLFGGIAVVIGLGALLLLPLIYLTGLRVARRLAT